jgi:hypothetical protein
MKAGAIATEVGVPRTTVLGWLREEHATDLGSSVNPANGDRTQIDADVAELRRELTILVDQVARMETLFEALTGLQERAA